MPGARTRPTVLVVTAQPGRRPGRSEHASFDWAFEYLRTPTSAELRALWTDQPPAIFLVHVDVVEQLDPATLLWMRRGAPNQVWLLVGPVNIESRLSFILDFGVQGWFDCDAPERMEPGLQAVMRGETWFSRDVQARLYKTLLAMTPAQPLPQPVGPRNPNVSLTPREAQTIELVRKGMTNKEIARQLQVSVNSVKKYLKSAFEKYGIKRRRQCFA